ncbi:MULTISPECIES: GNAT family N-acetyltransferase [unclassified Chelatococcus]|uniref:GNAT family N-acetyltransferase n=1 Tax=unclassified Chelatococcus TaxID=2638111 RepID=UPI001BCE2246|nr:MULTISPECIES: GNAT family N-acetyltransferase [unclassified Chelatococcus]MBS7695817.1 GNAT family N-acetyltransferase [Chelatococcus sp. YT9]MBX3555808.1 GNAT family N-acetyltransferase [Chelatococcus sp.]
MTSIRDATSDDLRTIIGLLAEDQLGRTREILPEDVLPASYLAAFAAITCDPNNRLIVMEDGGRVVGCCQLTFIPGLSYQGSTRGQIEGVRIAESHRNKGLGRELITYAINASRAHGCRFVQLTSNAVRTDARRFYERLGFVGSHVGMKLDLGS